MKDRYGRNIDYIRISITDRCNLRCCYCMPEEGVEHLCHEQILRFDEMLRLVKIFARLGIKKVKLTGGEPLVRKDIIGLIEEIGKVEGIEQITLTTNGLLLEENLERLVAAGISSINISLDTLSDEKYHQITRREGFEKVLSSINACMAYPQLRVKINVVTLADYNQDEVEALATFARDRNIDVRFIEMMPMGLGGTVRGYNQDIILEKLTVAFGQPVISKEKRGNGPAVYYKFDGFRGNIGLISALSHTFCGNCNRIRLTSEGFLKPCLNYSEGVDLRMLMREGADDEELLSIIEESIFNKPGQHGFCSETDREKDSRRMSSIGG